MGDVPLALERFGVAFGRRVVLASVDLALPHRGVTTLMGPVGVGKSTLLRTLAGRNDAEPSLRTWGRARYLGADRPWDARPALMGQGAKLLVTTVLESIVAALPNRATLQRAEQRALAAHALERLGFAALIERLDHPAIELSKFELRCVSLATAIAADTPLLLVDEPTAGLSGAERDRVLDVVRAHAETRAVLLVTHRRDDALAISGRTALLAGGAIVEVAPTEEFFRSPKTPIAQGFVETGSCAVVSPPSLDELVADGIVEEGFAEPRPQSVARAADTLPEPTLNLRWIEHGRLAGVRRPGLLGSLDRDLQLLSLGGIRLLVCLEESNVVSPDLLARYGIEGHSLAIVDMDVPAFDELVDLLRVIDDAIAGEVGVAVHCRAGLGRTGTVLCAYLIWKGLSRERALSRVRAVEPRFVQSERQHEFLAEFEARMRTAVTVAPSA